jgi:Lon-like protease
MAPQASTSRTSNNVDTVTETLPPPSPAGWARRHRTGLVAAVSVLAVIGLLVGVALAVTVPRVAFLPGSALSVADRIEVVGAPTFDEEGEILFVTVRFDDRVNLIEFVDMGLDPATDFIGRDEFFGDRTPQENRAANLELMRTSQNLAVLIALDQLGYDVYEEIGAGIRTVQEGEPADGALEPGDVVTALDGRPVGTTEDLVAGLRAYAPGQAVVLTVLHPDRGERTERVVLGARPDGTEGGFLGVSTSTAVEEKSLPVEVVLDTGDVGGNSAGLALTLAIIDSLTEGDLAGGRRVAVTGTIEVGGSVGVVGGIKQKTVAAERAGADLFIVPEPLAAEARRHAGDMEVVGVADLTGALAALADAGGNARELALPALAGS